MSATYSGELINPFNNVFITVLYHYRLAYCLSVQYPNTNSTFAQVLMGYKGDRDVETDVEIVKGMISNAHSCCIG